MSDRKVNNAACKILFQQLLNVQSNVTYQINRVSKNF